MDRADDGADDDAGEGSEKDAFAHTLRPQRQHVMVPPAGRKIKD